MNTSDTFLFLILIIIFIIVQIKPWAKKGKPRLKQTFETDYAVDDEHQQKLLKIQRARHSFEKKPILNMTERRVFFKLRAILQKRKLNLYCQPQIVTGAFIKHKESISGMCSRADILLTTPDFEAYAVVEINGTGHHSPKAAKGMEIKRAMCDSVDVSIYPIEVSENMADEELEREINHLVDRLQKSTL